MNWLAWAILLLFQNAAFTWVSRARNSGSVKWNMIASVFSNGVWFVGQMFIVNVFFVMMETGDLTVIIPAAIFYTAFTTAGSGLSQWVLLRFVERGKTRVGAR
jgi:hypothetical protein